MDPIRKIPNKFTKKSGNKVINRQYFRRKTGLYIQWLWLSQQTAAALQFADEKSRKQFAKKIYALVGHRPTAIKETKWQLLQDPHVSFYFSQLEKRNCFLNIYRCKYTQWFMGKVYHMYYLIGIAFGLFKLWNFKVIDLSYSHSELLKYLWIS